MTSIKMMSFGISQGIENEKLNKLVSDRVLANLDQLNLKDIKSLTHFYSRSSNVNKKLLFTLKGEISIYFENAVSISELVDVMNCLSYMSVTEVYRLEVIFPILESFKHTEPSEVVHKNLASIAETIVKNLAKTALNSDKILSDMSTLRSNRRYASTICRVPAFLCFNLRLDEIDLEHSMSMDLAAAILALSDPALATRLAHVLQEQFPRYDEDHGLQRALAAHNQGHGQVRCAAQRGRVAPRPPADAGYIRQEGGEAQGHGRVATREAAGTQGGASLGYLSQRRRTATVIQIPGKGARHKPVVV